MIGASGRRVRLSGVRIDRFDEESRIAESWFHWDSLGMLEQIGALPPLDRRPAQFSPVTAERQTRVPRIPAPTAPAVFEAPVLNAPER